jgi:ketosteroid isomerase-like protein
MDRSVKRIVFMVALAAAALGNAAQAQDNAQSLIQRELDDMLAAWNRDDLDAHIVAYADSATWTTATGLLHGKAAIKQSLVRGFQRGTELLGELSFGPSEFRRLSDDVMMTNGSFRVAQLPSGKDINGQSTLIWKRIGGRWRIVHDHSS